MAKAANKVIAGDYIGKSIMLVTGIPNIYLTFLKRFPIDKTTIEEYEVVTDEHMKSAASGVARGIVGGVLLGPVGMLAGIIGQK